MSGQPTVSLITAMPMFAALNRQLAGRLKFGRYATCGNVDRSGGHG
jgi:hypothetical protein